MDDQEQQIKKIEERLDTLESNHQNKIEEILDVLKKIYNRLMGDIEKDKIGLIQEVKDLSKENNDIKIKIVQLELVQKENIEKIDRLNKYKWIIYGGIAVLTFIVTQVIGLARLLKLW